MLESNTASNQENMKTVAGLRDFSYTYPGGREPVLNGIDLDISSGTCYLITGDTGSGKSTFLMALKGLLPPGRRQGEIIFPCHRQTEEPIGLVLQNPETQLLSPTVGSECAFALENMQVEESLMKKRVLSALQEVGLDKDLDTPVEHLSMGQKYRLLLASMLVMDPKLLILDEPAAQLDRDGLDKLQEIIRALKERGMAFVISEHNQQALSAVADVGFRLLEGKLNQFCATSEEFLQGQTHRDRPVRCAYISTDNPVLESKGLSFSYSSGKSIWRDIDFILQSGERAVLVGKNGTGKSTMIRCLCGFLRPEAGKVCVLGKKPIPRELCSKVGYLLQNPQRQLFETTVFKEIEFTLKRKGWDRRQRLARVNTLLEQCGLRDVSESSPYKLSYGQQHLAALAAVIAPVPQLLLLDDPFVGLDQSKKQAIIQIICEMSDTQGTAVLYAGHDLSENFPWAHSYYLLSGGTIVG